LSEALLIAVINLVSKVGFTAAITFLENRGASIDDAIAALRKAQSVSLEEIIRQEAAKIIQPPALPA
jgi:hypothetical protein